MPPSEEEAARFGLTVEEASAPPVQLWPDNVLTVNVFQAMGTQWRVGASGATGLDYNALPVVMRLSDVSRKDWPVVFDGIRVMEVEALSKMHEKED